MSEIKFYTPKQCEIEGWINSLGFRTQLEVPFGQYCMDIFLPELNWGVEVDGIGHWKKKDEKRNDYLYKNYGIDCIIHVRVEIEKQEFEQVFKDCLERKYGKNGIEKGIE